MRRDEAIVALRRREPTARARGVEALFLFGSTARDEGRADSDLDVFVDLRPGSALGLGFIGLKRAIEQATGVACDVSTRASLHPVTAGSVQAEAVKVF
jgi:predicted nucleotidyltransferase